MGRISDIIIRDVGKLKKPYNAVCDRQNNNNNNPQFREHKLQLGVNVSHQRPIITFVTAVSKSLVMERVFVCVCVCVCVCV